MNKLIIAGIAGLALVSTAASAVGLSAQVGERYTNISVGLGTNSAGLALSGNYAHSVDDGSTVGLGLGFNLPIGPLMGTAGGRAVYLHPKDNDEGFALAIGGGLSWQASETLSVFGDYYYSPDSLSSAVKNYQEANAGLRWTFLRPVSVEAGYRYIGLKGKNGDRNNTIADGPYVGVSASF